MNAAYAVSAELDWECMHTKFDSSETQGNVRINAMARWDPSRDHWPANSRSFGPNLIMC